MNETNSSNQRPVRVALYVHVPGSDDRAGAELAILRRNATERGWEVVAQFVDRGPVWRQDRRPAMRHLMEGAHARAFDTVLVLSFARCFCSGRHVVSGLGDLAVLGVRLCSLHEGFDTATVAGRQQMDLVYAILEMKGELLSERFDYDIEASPERSGVENARTRRRRRLRVVPLPALAAVV